MQRTPFPSHAIAYLRVSTKQQGESGGGLDGQLAGVRAFADHIGVEIVEIYKDVASAVGRHSLAQRPGLQAALRHAKSSGLPIVVYDLERLFRDVIALGDFLKEGIPIFCASQDLVIPPGASAAALAARGQAHAEAISATTKAALSARKANGMLLGNRTNLEEAQKAGALSNRLRAGDVINQVADFLAMHPGSTELTAAEIVDLLNAAGLQSGRGLPWTVSGLRRPLAKAKQLLPLRVAADYRENPEFGRF